MSPSLRPWPEGERMSTLSNEELEAYSRHLLLPDFGLRGQEALRRASAVIVGAGGLGSPILFYLAAAGVGRIGIVDHDLVDLSNLQRQIIFCRADIGKSKALVAAQRLNALNPLVNVESYATRLDEHNAASLLSSYDLVIDGTDNFRAKYLINDAAFFAGKPLVYGSIYQFEGQVSVFNLNLKGEWGPNYRDLFPVPPPPELAPSCAETGVLGVLPGIIGAMQANEAIKVLSGIGEVLSGRLFVYDALRLRAQVLTIRKNPHNPLSGDRPTIKSLVAHEDVCRSERVDADTELGMRIFLEMIESNADFQLIDVRDPYERSLLSLGGESVPLSAIQDAVHRIRRDVPVVLYCLSGKRSQRGVAYLRGLGEYHNVRSLEGGLELYIKSRRSTGEHKLIIRGIQ